MIVTLLTDFGLKDGNVGVMKGVIWGIAPDARIVDLSHFIGAQDVKEAALILLRSAPYFPAGTVHVVVVDPGVGTARRPIAAQIGEQYFVGPDNGVITMWLASAESKDVPVRFVHLDQPQYWLPQVSNVFHGRDIFAPVGGHLAAGISLDDVGVTIEDSIYLEMPQPQRTDTGWRGEVIHLDHFGNISTNIRGEHLAREQVVMVNLCGVNINGMVKTFGDRGNGELVALFGSTGNLIVSVVKGSAAGRLNAKIGDVVDVKII